MSSGVQAHFYLRDPLDGRDAQTLLRQMVDSLAALSFVHRTELRMPEPRAVLNIREEWDWPLSFHGADEDGERFGFDLVARSENVIRARHLWSPDYVAGPQEEWDARLWLWRDSPLYPYRPHADENIVRFTTILGTLIRAIDPYMVKVFDEGGGLPFPYNAHLAYFRDDTALLDDLRFLRRLWNEGWPIWRCPPLRDLGHILHDNGAQLAGSQQRVDDTLMHNAVVWAFSDRRTPNERRHLWHALGQALTRVDDVTSHTIASIRLAAGCDWSAMASGYVVQHAPYFMTAFLDDLYLTLCAPTTSA